MSSISSDAVSASMARIFCATSYQFTSDEMPVVEQAMSELLGEYGPGELDQITTYVCSSTDDANALVEIALAASQPVADIDSISDSESNWVKPLDSITATPATSGADAQSASRGCTPEAVEGDGLAPEINESETGGVAGIADALAATLANPPAIPLLGDLMYGEFQFWRNEPKPKRSEWVIKVRVATSADDYEFGRLRPFLLSFLSNSKDLRYRVNEQVRQGRVSPAWAEYLCELSLQLAPNQKIAQVTKSLFPERKKVSKGKSSNERQCFEQFAVLTLDPAGTIAWRQSGWLQASI